MAFYILLVCFLSAIVLMWWHFTIMGTAQGVFSFFDLFSEAFSEWKTGTRMLTFSFFCLSILHTLCHIKNAQQPLHSSPMSKPRFIATTAKLCSIFFPLFTRSRLWPSVSRPTSGALLGGCVNVCSGCIHPHRFLV